jgi:uncharacterized protein YkwD
VSRTSSGEEETELTLATRHTSPLRRAALALVAAALAASYVTSGVLAGAQPAPGTATAVAAITYPYAPWLTDEAFYLKLINCTRTGGWVQANGSCSAYGSGKYSKYVKPLVRSPGISDKASRPYAKVLATVKGCGHNFDGSLTSRLARAGFSGSAWGENLACHGGLGTRAMVIWAQRVFQSEKGANGAHWKNLKNPRYTQIGIGVWQVGNDTRLVTDFFRA